MAKKLLILLSISLLVACKTENVKGEKSLSVQEADTGQVSLQEYCSHNPCRKNIKVKFRTKKREIDTLIPEYWPAVYRDTISILPGEKIYIEVVMDSGVFKNFTQVKAVENPEKTITLSFDQMDDDVAMMLQVNNPFQEVMKYNINMMDFAGKLHKTSSCPVRPGFSVFESWPHAIPELRLSNFLVLKQSESMACVY